MSTTQPARFAPRRPESIMKALPFWKSVRHACGSAARREARQARNPKRRPPARPARPFGLPPGGLPLSEMIGPPLALLAMGALLFAFAVITP